MIRRLALAAMLFLATPAGAAEIAVDVSDGRVLVARDAGAPRWPASLVKLMTLRLAYVAIEEGRIGLSDEVTVSANAAAQPPVRLGLKAGRTLPFGEALAAAAIGSRNDAAMVVAEAVAGSEAAFVALMNAEAIRLGLEGTRYVNPTGLPRPGQRTTARDVATLSLSLLRDYPVAVSLLERRTTRAAGRTVRTTNPLFGRVAGAKGLKTGFTCAAGYGIAGLVEREGRSVLVVTLGHRTKGSRLAAAKDLIRRGFASGGVSPRPDVSVAVDPPDIGACGSAPAVATTDLPPAEIAAFEAELAAARRRAARPRPTPAARPAQPPPLAGWGVFLGAFPSEADAGQALRSLPGVGVAEQRARDGKRLAFRHSLDRATASRLCRQLRAAGRYCLVLAPGTLRNPAARWRR